MSGYELVPHTADVAVKARGKSEQELVAQAIAGMFAAAGPRYAPEGQSVTREISVAARDASTRLVDALNEVWFLAATRREAYQRARVFRYGDEGMMVQVIGHPVTGFATEMKAATYHGLAVTPPAVQPDGSVTGEWEATVVFDV